MTSGDLNLDESAQWMKDFDLMEIRDWTRAEQAIEPPANYEILYLAVCHIVVRVRHYLPLLLVKFCWLAAPKIEGGRDISLNGWLNL